MHEWLDDMCCTNYILDDLDTVFHGIPIHVNKKRLVNLDTVFHGLDHYFNVNMEHTTTLQDAAARGDINEVEKLLRENADVNAVDYDRRTALHLACCEGYTDVVQLLISNGANFNMKDRWGNQPLKDAVSNGHTRITALLTLVGAVLSMESQRDLEHTLYRSASESNFIRLQCLLKCGIAVNGVDGERRSALHHAASSGHLDAVRYLLAYGADPYSSNYIGQTAADEADVGGHVDVAREIRRVQSTVKRNPHAQLPLRLHAYYCPMGVTVLFVDIKGFTTRCGSMDARAAGEWVTAFYKHVDDAAALFGVRKAEVRGDCCICVTGDLADAPCRRLQTVESASDQVTRMLNFACALYTSLKSLGGVNNMSPTLVRMGIAFGEVSFLLGGFEDCQFVSVQGDIVNIAARMEASASVGTVSVHGSAAIRWASEASNRRVPRCRPCECKGKDLQPVATFDCELGIFVAGITLNTSRSETYPKPGKAMDNSAIMLRRASF